MDDTITVSAPGSIMITGEHAVVYGHPAIVAAIEQRVMVEMSFTDDAVLSITSQIAEAAQLPMDSLVAEGPYRFVIAAVLRHRERLSGGLHLNIRSEIDPTLGLGSSAAVTVATLAGLEGAATLGLHDQALGIVRELQGRGSGADLAASLHGGVLSYQLREDGPAAALPLPIPPQMSLFNVGYKTPTAKVLARVAKAREDDPAEIDAIYQEMGDMSAETIDLARDGDWEATGPHLTAYQHLMQRLGVSDDALDAAVARAMVASGVIGAKISGSGLGDCVLSLGDVPKGFTPVELARQGVVFHENA
ncbi:MAG: mevalonate kinase [Pseudomonadota bacterium]